MKKTYLLLFLLTIPLFIVAQDISVKRNYFLNGSVARECFYNADKKLTHIKTYHIEEGINEDFSYDSNGNPHGQCYQYTSEGKLKTTWEFNHGNLINRNDFIVEFNIKNRAKVEANIAQVIKANKEINQNPNSIYSFYRRAAAREFLGNNLLAEQDYLKLKSVFEKMKKDKPAQDANITAKINRTLADIYDRLATINTAFENKNKAIEYFLKGVKADATDTRLANNLGAYLQEIGQNREALYYLNIALKKNPIHAFANWSSAAAYSDLEQYQLALKHVNISLSREDMLYKRGKGTSENDLRTIRGLVYHKLGQSDLGIADLNEALQINNKNSLANKNLGLIYLDLGQNDKACDYFQKARALYYEKKYYLKNLDSLIQKACSIPDNIATIESLPAVTKESDKNEVTEIISEVETNESITTLNILANPSTAPYIAPNPAEEKIDVYNFAPSDFRFKIFNTESSLVREGMSFGKTITVTGLPAGLYLLTIEKGISKHTFKLIKQ